MPMYEFECGKCGGRCEEYRPVSDRDRPAMCRTCAGMAARVVSATSRPVIGPGRTASSQHEHKTRVRESLTKRSLAYDQTSRGRDERRVAVESQKAAGNLL